MYFVEFLNKPDYLAALYFGLLSVAVIDVFGISRVQTGACVQQVTGGLAVMFMLPMSGKIQ